MDKEYSKKLKQFHELTKRHVLELEADASFSDTLKILSDAERLRKAGNELTGFMNKKYMQLIRTKKYKNLVKLIKNEKDENIKASLKKELDSLKEKYNVTWNVCRTHAKYLEEKYKVKSVLMLTKAEDVWSGVETCMYRNGKHLNFAKFGEYSNITLEGKAFPKRYKDGTIKHKFGKGLVASDIGTQTRAVVTDKLVELKNLAERGPSILENERKERLLLRAMDRSKRAMNPDNYNADGTIKKGPKTWKYSKHYKKLRQQHQDLCRKNAANRHYAINEDVNYLRSLGDTFITEPKNSAKLAKRSKNTTINKKGKINKKKRFGKSIKNRCPGYFQEHVKQVFESTGGKYIEVDNDYRASQYEHIKDDYIKKKLSQRMFKLNKNIKVQRDLYSAFLLFCYKDGTIDKDKCKKEFKDFYKKQNKFIKDVKKNNIKILNSGIK